MKELLLSCFIITSASLYPKMKHCCHILVRAIQSPLSSLDRVQNHLYSLVDDDLLSTLKPLSTQTKVKVPLR